MQEFPAFTAGDGSWTVACDGSALIIKGMTRHVRSDRAEQVNSLIPLASLTHAALIRQAARAAKLTIRVWDGEDYAIGVIHDDSPEVIAGLQAFVAEVSRTNASWPMSTSRAAAARAQIPPGYLRDACFLGRYGKEEFWSPLSDLPWIWASRWTLSPLSQRWPKAALATRSDDGEVLLALLENSVVVMDAAAQIVEIPFTQLQMPQIVLGDSPPASPEALENMHSLGLRLTSAEGAEVGIMGVAGVEVQPIFRFLLMRWAESEASRAASPTDIIAVAATDMADGRMPAVAYAALVDAVVAGVSGISLSIAYPPRERDYLRRETPTQLASARQPLTAQTPGQTPPRTGVNPRQVAAGAAAGAALWNLFSA
jgi:hypothetical protein